MTYPRRFAPLGVLLLAGGAICQQPTTQSSQDTATSSAHAPTVAPLPSMVHTRAAEEAANSALRQAVLNQSLAVPNGIPRPVYGADDRKNYDDSIVTAAQRHAADATAILVHLQDITASPDKKTVNLRGGNVLDAATGTGLCSDTQTDTLHQPKEPFYNEPNPGYCSAVRVAKNRIATAGHCIQTTLDCQTTRIIFGFYHSPVKLHPERSIPIENVYSCKRIVAGTLTPDGADWRVVELDRSIPLGSDVELHTADISPPLQVGDALTVIGYPLGLPVKIARGAIVRGFGQGFLVANLDTYEGNSGSAVFNTERLESGELLVEGLLVRGENDFSLTSPCFLSKRCPSTGCRGEDVTLASEVAPGLSSP